jgi:hypothetical protein
MPLVYSFYTYHTTPHTPHTQPLSSCFPLAHVPLFWLPHVLIQITRIIQRLLRPRENLKKIRTPHPPQPGSRSAVLPGGKLAARHGTEQAERAYYFLSLVLFQFFSTPLLFPAPSKSLACRSSADHTPRGAKLTAGPSRGC